MNLDFEIEVVLEDGEDERGKKVLIARLGEERVEATIIFDENTEIVLAYLYYGKYYATEEGFVQAVIQSYLQKIKRQVFGIK